MALAAYYFVYLLIVYIKETKTNKLYFKMPSENVNMQSHLKFERVLNYCSHRDDACRSNNTNVCAVKMVKEKKIHKDFMNGCYLFLSNMCDHPGDEYFIAASGSCEQYLTTRREEEPEVVPTASTDDEVGKNTNSSENFGDNFNISAAGALREKSAPSAKPFTKKYDEVRSYDDHICPLTCPNIYSPVCVNVNRGRGKYFKMLNFVNHCTLDVYYCDHWREFSPPPDERFEKIQSSGLDWSLCADNRYLQFARFSDVASSMGHFGWLTGDFKYSHIMEPHQRIPGYG